MKKVIILLVTALLTLSANARKFYFSVEGNDSYTTTQAQNQSTPWQTLRKLTSAKDIILNVTYNPKLLGGIVIEYDSTWPHKFLEHQKIIKDALGETAFTIEHIGSTAVPGLAAKPIIC